MWNGSIYRHGLLLPLLHRLLVVFSPDGFVVLSYFSPLEFPIPSEELPRPEVPDQGLQSLLHPIRLFYEIVIKKIRSQGFFGGVHSGSVVCWMTLTISLEFRQFFVDINLWLWMALCCLLWAWIGTLIFCQYKVYWCLMFLQCDLPLVGNKSPDFEAEAVFDQEFINVSKYCSVYPLYVLCCYLKLHELYLIVWRNVSLSYPLLF